MSDTPKINDSELAEGIEAILASIISSQAAELRASTEQDLGKNWYFQWDEAVALRINLYRFQQALTRFESICRQWEEQHNGTCCVVERVRDKYLMPKIKEFLANLTESNKVLQDIATERQRQLGIPGLAALGNQDPDDAFVRAAVAYALCDLGIPGAAGIRKLVWRQSPADMPFEDQRSNLVRAAALLIAQIELIDQKNKPRPPEY